MKLHLYFITNYSGSTIEKMVAIVAKACSTGAPSMFNVEEQI